MDGQVILLEWIGARAIDDGLRDRVRQQIEAAFALPTAFRVVDEPPAETLDPRRAQHSSTKILRWILGRVPPWAAKVVGVTDADLFIPALTFVFGEAQVGGLAAVVSTARLIKRYDGRPATFGQVEARLIKECLHELGHTFGLVHCPEAGCVMSRSNSVLDVDRKRATFCRNCRQRLREIKEKRCES